jgi:hypothetical protein
LKLPSLYPSLGLLFFYCYFSSSSSSSSFIFSHSIAFDHFLFPLLTLKTANGGMLFRRFSYENGKSSALPSVAIGFFLFLFHDMDGLYLFSLFQSSTQ